MNNMNKPAMNLQDSFLNHVRKENLGVVIYLMNGFQLRGLVRGFDNFTVIIENDGSNNWCISTQFLQLHLLLTSPLCNLKNVTRLQKETSLSRRLFFMY